MFIENENSFIENENILLESGNVSEERNFEINALFILVPIK